MQTNNGLGSIDMRMTKRALLGASSSSSSRTSYAVPASTYAPPSASEPIDEATAAPPQGHIAIKPPHDYDTWQRCGCAGVKTGSG